MAGLCEGKTGEEQVQGLSRQWHWRSTRGREVEALSSRPGTACTHLAVTWHLVVLIYFRIYLFLLSEKLLQSGAMSYTLSHLCLAQSPRKCLWYEKCRKKQMNGELCLVGKTGLIRVGNWWRQTRVIQDNLFGEVAGSIFLGLKPSLKA